ncbi:MAG: flippase [Saprospiraceae bacterium]|nr:flippase [Saprospiraceae bacterium]
MRNYWLKSGFLSLMEKLSVQLFAFGAVFLLFRALTKEAFGTWAIFLTIAAIIEVARIGLLQNALVKFLSTADKEAYGKISTASLVLNILITVLTITFLILIAGPAATFFKMPDLEVLLQIYAWTNVSLIPFFQMNYIQQANLDFRGIFWSNFVRQGIFFGLVLGLFLAGEGFSLTELAYFQIIAALGGSLVAFFFARPFLHFTKKIDFDWINRLFQFGIYVFGTNAATQLFKSTDKFLLGRIPVAGPVSVALYEAAIKITNLTDVPTFSMASILFPQSARKALEGKAAIKDLYEKAVGAILSIMVPVIFVVFIFAKPAILIVAGSQYLEAVPVLRVTILFGLFIPYAVQFGTVLDSIGMPRINFLFTAVSLVLLAVIDYFMIWGFGTIGAAYGTLATYAITFVAMQYFLHKKLGVNPLRPILYIPYFYLSFFKKVHAVSTRKETIFSKEETEMPVPVEETN